MITTLNASAPIAHRISNVSLVGEDSMNVTWSVTANGLLLLLFTFVNVATAFVQP